MLDLIKIWFKLTIVVQTFTYFAFCEPIILYYNAFKITLLFQDCNVMNKYYKYFFLYLQ